MGPTLASVLLMASSSATSGRGFLLVSVYTPGFVLPFLAVGLFTGAVLDFFRRKRNVVRYTVKIGAVLLILRRQMRTARPQRYAGDYAVPGSFQLTLQRDIYLYSRTTRVKRQTTQNGDSFHGGGSSTHRSSSGSSHGGSHGKF